MRDCALVMQITKTADGYQPHMVSPEKGLRLMAAKALDQVEDPVRDCVHDVYNLLVSSAREAAQMAGEFTEAAMSGKVPLNVPEYKNFIMPAVVRALDEWKKEAEKSKCNDSGVTASAYTATSGTTAVQSIAAVVTQQHPVVLIVVDSTQQDHGPHARLVCVDLQCLICWWIWSAATSQQASSATP